MAIEYQLSESYESWTDSKKVVSYMPSFRRPSARL